MAVILVLRVLGLLVALALGQTGMYKRNDTLDIMVVWSLISISADTLQAIKLTSVRRQMPFDYYHLSFCQPKSTVYRHESIGQILLGDRLVNTPYTLQIGVNETCRLVACGSGDDEEDVSGRVYKHNEARQFEKFIKEQYYIHWSVEHQFC